MGKPAYIAIDLARTAIAIIGAPLADATNYPAVNVGDGILAKASRLTFHGGSYEINVDSSPFVSYDSVFVGNHSLTSAGTFNVRGNTVTGSGGSYIGFGTWRKKNMWVNVGTQSVNNFIRVELDQTIGSTGQPVEVGEIVVGPRVLLPRAPFWTNGEGVQKRDTTTGITNETLGGIRRRYKLSQYRVIQPTWVFPESEYQAFLDFSEACDAISFVYIPDVDSNEAYSMTKEFGFEPQSIGPAMDGAAMAHWYRWSPPFRADSEGIATT